MALFVERVTCKLGARIVILRTGSSGDFLVMPTMPASARNRRAGKVIGSGRAIGGGVRGGRSHPHHPVCGRWWLTDQVEQHGLGPGARQFFDPE